MKYLIFLIFLAGCATANPTIVQTEKQKIVIPSTIGNRCYNSIPQIPNTKNLTNRQLIVYISNLISSNKICKNSIQYIYKYVDDLNKLNDQNY